MEIGKAIYNILVNDSDVNTLVSGRILPNVARTTTAFPFIIYQVTGQNPEQDKDGTSTYELSDEIKDWIVKEHEQIQNRVDDVLRTNN